MMISNLYLLQFGCCITVLLLALMLVISRVHARWRNMHYEQSRWMLFLAMILLAIHYILQMRYDLRASSDKVGAVVNILFYMPVYYLVSYAALCVESSKAACRRCQIVSAVSYALVVTVFVASLYYYRSLRIGDMLYVMYAMFVGNAFFLVVNTIREMRIKHRRIEDQTGADMQPYVRYSLSGFILMGASALMTVFAVLSRTMLYIIAPIMFLSLFIFIMSFVALGYSITPIEEILNEDDSSEVADSIADMGNMQCGTCKGTRIVGENELCEFDAGQMAAITSILDEWRKSGEFRNNSSTLVMLSRQTNISRRDLTIYFGQYLHRTFRMWLSDIRMAEAERLILTHPEYGNDIISAECGFSSRSQLYKLFRDRYGMTPKEWREHQMTTT